MIVCVTGMHRSGTSLVASWLSHCGLSMLNGSAPTPAVGNPRGDFEDKDLVKLHATALSRLDPGSKGWKTCARAFLGFAESEREQAVRLVRERNAKYSDWGWKDPRTIHFLPAWRDIVPDLKVVVVWRSSTEVVDSLVRRGSEAANGRYDITALESLRLWRTCNRLACDFKLRHRADTMLLSIRDLIRDSGSVIARINAKFGTRLDAREIDGVYAPDLLHAVSPPPSPRVDGCRFLEARLSHLADGRLTSASE
jgi:hypothetical protein